MPQQLPILDQAADALPVMSVNRAEHLAAVFKVLADPVRLRLLHHIAANCCSSVCVCHMPDQLGISQPTLSYHLAKLTKAGLVEKQMRHKWAHYSATPEGLTAIRDFLQTLLPGEQCQTESSS